VKDTAARKKFLDFPLFPVFPFSEKNYFSRTNILSPNLGGEIKIGKN
jgi:hypothetical protein